MNPSGTRLSQACGGRSPEVWNGTGQWPINGNPLFSSYFTPAMGDSTLKCKTVIDASKGCDAVARHCLAAFLNAMASPPLTPASILGVSLVKAVWSSYATKGYFEPSAGIRWNGGQIVDWIKTTYS